MRLGCGDQSCDANVIRQYHHLKFAVKGVPIVAAGRHQLVGGGVMGREGDVEAGGPEFSSVEQVTRQQFCQTFWEIVKRMPRSVRLFTDRHRPLFSQKGYWLCLLLIGYLSARWGIHLATLVDPERLVPVSTLSVILSIPSVLFLYLFGAMFVYYFSKLPNRIELFTVLFLLRVLVGIILALTFQYDDEVVFHTSAIKQQVYGLSVGGGGYYNVMNMLYAAFGPNLLLPKVINAFLGSLLPFIVYDVGRQIFDDPASGKRAFWFAGFLPPLVVFSAVNLKEIATALLLVIIPWFLISAPRYAVLKIMGVATSTVVLYWLRGAPWVAVAMAGVAVHIIVPTRFRGWLRLRLWSRVVLIGIVAYLVWPILIKPVTHQLYSRITQEAYFIERFSGSSATVMQFIDTQNPLTFKNIFILFFRGLFSPSPLRFVFDYSLATLIEAVSMIVWYVLFPFALVGFLAERRKGATLALGMIAIGVLVLSSVGIIAGADPYRHRIAGLGLLCILAGGGLKRGVFRKYRWVSGLWWLGAFVFTGAWIGLRF